MKNGLKEIGDHLTTMIMITVTTIIMTMIIMIGTILVRIIITEIKPNPEMF